LIFAHGAFLKILSSCGPSLRAAQQGFTIKNPRSKKNEALREQALKLADKILKGSYFYNKGNERLEINDEYSVNINLTSSGQQEVVWIVNLLFYYLLQGKPKFIIIEEPESSLFPEAQKQIVELIALFANAGHNVLITTHSPYVLGSINNLLFADSITKKIAGKTNKIIGQNMWIPKKSLGAWFIHNGKLQKAMNTEAGQIKNELIDKISKVINEDFDKLLNLAEISEEAGE
jgi:ABC-type multidrug transport system ATPase subunit